MTDLAPLLSIGDRDGSCCLKLCYVCVDKLCDMARLGSQHGLALYNF
jgi:hypothetical protein